MFLFKQPLNIYLEEIHVWFHVYVGRKMNHQDIKAFSDELSALKYAYAQTISMSRDLRFYDWHIER